MSYTLRNSFSMGPAYTGKSLRGQIVDDAGSNVGSAITTATELTGGKGVFEQIATIPDGQTGFLRIYFSDAPTVFLASIPLNPQEIENADVKTSTRSTLTTSDIDARLAAYDAATGTEAAAILAAIAALNNLSSAGAQAAAAAALVAYDAATAADVAAVAATVAAMNPNDVDSGTLIMRTAATFDGEVTNLTSLIYVDWTKAIFTMKYTSLGSTDAVAILQIQVSNPPSGSNDGLLIVNGAEATKNQASLSINAGTGVATIHITDNAMAEIVPDAENYKYDVKFYDSAGNSRATSPMPVVVNPIVTQTV